MMISIIGIDATKNAAQISIRTGQLNLFEKKTTSPPPDTHAAQSTSFDGFQHPSYLLLNRRYCLGWEQKSPVTEANPFSSVLRSWLEFNFTNVPGEKTCHVPCCRRYGRVCSHMSEQYHRQSWGGQQLEIS